MGSRDLGHWCSGSTVAQHVAGGRHETKAPHTRTGARGVTGVTDGWHGLSRIERLSRTSEALVRSSDGDGGISGGGDVDDVAEPGTRWRMPVYCRDRSFCGGTPTPGFKGGCSRLVCALDVDSTQVIHGLGSE